MAILRRAALLDRLRAAQAVGISTTTMTSLSEVQRPLWPRRLHSIAGVLPLLSFLVLHLWINAQAMQGELRYDRTVQKLSAMPGLVVLELLGIFLPLAYHAGYGLWVMQRADRRAPRPPHEPSWVPQLQKVSGLVTLGFLFLHLATFRLPVALGRLHLVDLYPELTDTLSFTTRLGIPFQAVLYSVGLAAVSYHLTVGLTAFGFTFGLVTTERGRRLASAVATAVGTSCFLLGARTIVYFAAGAALP